jgi:hypothetical protein
MRSGFPRGLFPVPGYGSRLRAGSESSISCAWRFPEILISATPTCVWQRRTRGIHVGALLWARRGHRMKQPLGHLLFEETWQDELEASAIRSPAHNP